MSMLTSTLEMIKCFDSKLQGLSRQVGSDWFDPPLLILRLLKLICNQLLVRARSAVGVLLRWGLESRCHSAPEFWFCWYMEALSFSRTRHRWQLQLPAKQGGKQHIISPLTARSQSFRSPLCSETNLKGLCVCVIFWKISSKISMHSWRNSRGGMTTGFQGSIFQVPWRRFLMHWRSSYWDLEMRLPLLSVNSPSGGSVMGGLRQYMW